MIIEDLEFEHDGRYARISIDDEISEEEYDRIYDFLRSVVKEKKIPILKER